MPQADHTIGQVSDAIVAVLGDHDRQAKVGKAAQLADELAGGVVVKLRGRLIEQQHCRFWCEYRGEGHALALACRQLVDAPADQVISIDALERGPGRGEDRLGRRPVALQAKGDIAQWLGHHHLRFGVLKQKARALCDFGGLSGAQVDAGDQAFASSLTAMKGGREAGQNTQERRFAAARLAFEQDNLARFDLEARASDRPGRVGGVSKTQIVGNDRRHERVLREPAATTLTRSVSPAKVNAMLDAIGSAMG